MSFLEALGSPLIALVVGPQQTHFAVHRGIALRVPFLRTALESFREGVDGRVFLPADEPETVARLLEFIYAGNHAKPDVDAPDELGKGLGLARLFLLADKWTFDPLADACLEGINKLSMTSKQMLEYWKFVYLNSEDGSRLRIAPWPVPVVPTDSNPPPPPPQPTIAAAARRAAAQIAPPIQTPEIPADLLAGWQGPLPEGWIVGPPTTYASPSPLAFIPPPKTTRLDSFSVSTFISDLSTNPDSQTGLHAALEIPGFAYDILLRASGEIKSVKSSDHARSLNTGWGSSVRGRQGRGRGGRQEYPGEGPPVDLDALMRARGNS